MKKLIYVTLLCITGSPALAAQTFYVQSVKAKLQARPAYQSPLVATLARGDAVQVLEKDKRWYKVTYQQQTGWISRLVLGATPPGDKITVLDAAGGNAKMESNARRRASSSNTAAATRGLRGDSRSRMSDEGHADYSALETMKSQAVTEQEALEFLQEGVKQ
jgi:uncharacterized protein YgiM (DUF1202 family)